MIRLFNITFNLKYIILPIIYIIIGFIIYKAVRQVLDKTIRIEKITLKSHKQRAITLKLLIQNTIKYIIVVLVFLAILSVYGVNVKSIVAGLGITTAIIGLAFQDFAKDIIAGISIITEGQYDVGDTIEADGFMGEVISLGLKTTKIKNFKGAIKIISNRYMDKVINYSLEDSLAIVDIELSHKNTLEDIENVLNGLTKSLEGKIPFATGNIEIVGINNLSTSSVVYRITVKTKPMQHYTAERIIKKELKAAFDKANILIPFPQIEVHNGK